MMVQNFIIILLCIFFYHKNLKYFINITLHNIIRVYYEIDNKFGIFGL